MVFPPSMTKRDCIQKTMMNEAWPEHVGYTVHKHDKETKPESEIASFLGLR
jgi:hypothetical protein